MLALLADKRFALVNGRPVHERNLVIRQPIIHRFNLTIDRFPVHPVTDDIWHALHTDELPATGCVVILTPYHVSQMRQMRDGVLRQFSSR